MAQTLPITPNSAQLDPEQYVIMQPVSATIAAQTIFNSDLNVKLKGFAVNNTTGSAATLTIKDGYGNEIISAASFDGNQTQFVETQPGYYFNRGMVLLSDTDNALKVWLEVKKM